MPKALMNHHKWKRRLGRSKTRTAYSAASPSSRDFSLHRGSTTNPYHRPTKPGVGWKKKLQLLLLLICLAGTVSFLLFHATFHIEKIVISGADQTSEANIRRAAEEYLGKKKWWVLSQQNYFIANTEALSALLLSKFPLSNVTVHKTFPSTMTIALTEKTSTLVLVRGTEVILVGQDGTAVETARIFDESLVVTSTVRLPDTTSTLALVSSTVESTVVNPAQLKQLQENYPLFPIIIDEREVVSTTGEQLLKPDTIAAIRSWYEHLANTSKLFIDYTTLNSGLGEGTITMEDGWHVKTRFLSSPTAVQFTAFDSALHDATINHAALQYIDVRFGNRVFWK